MRARKFAIQSFDADADVATDVIISALRRNGAVLVTNAVSTETIDKVNVELRPWFDSEGKAHQSDFNGYTTLRLSGVLAKSRASADLIAHPLVLDAAETVLRPHCSSFRLGSASAIEILPGEKAQVLHRDDSIYPLRIPGVEWQISALWALTDFTPENGATRLVPGSHLLTEADSLEEKNAVQASMKKGGLLLYLGTTYHGGGANTSDKTRIGLVNTYSLGWLRVEENHYLTVPRDVAESYPEPVRNLLGYSSHAGLGWYPEVANFEH